MITAQRASADRGQRAGTDRGQRAGVDRRAMATLSAGHLFTDIAQGSVPALLPFLHSRYHWSLAALSGLVYFASLVNWRD